MFIRTRKERDDIRRCKICDYEIQSNFRYHFRKAHKLKILDYYNVYIKRPYEGICLECGRQTTLRDYVLGYRLFCDRKCLLIYYKKKFVLMKIKQNRINELMKNITTCKICNITYSDIDLLCYHIKKEEGLSIKKYYDKYFKERNKDHNICIYTQCSNNTLFINYQSGYRMFCSDCNFLVFYGHDLKNPYDTSNI